MASLAMYSNLYDHEFYNGFCLHLNILGLTTVSDINSSKMIDLDFVLAILISRLRQWDCID
jgi:hypothetical protein